MTGTHPKIFFECENSVPVVSADCSRGKAYLLVRCEAKQPAGAPDRICSKKDILG